jgi:hypothetical protein
LGGCRNIASNVAIPASGAGLSLHRCNSAGVQEAWSWPAWDLPAGQLFGNAFDLDCRRITDRSTRMIFLSYAYRFVSNFVFLALVYLSLNFMEKYQQRTIVAVLILVYSAMRAASALRTFYFYQRVERLEVEARRLAALAGEGPNAAAARKQIVKDVQDLRQGGEMKSYIDLLFLALVVLLCLSKIVTD